RLDGVRREDGLVDLGDRRDVTGSLTVAVEGGLAVGEEHDGVVLLAGLGDLVEAAVPVRPAATGRRLGHAVDVRLDRVRAVRGGDAGEREVAVPRALRRREAGEGVDGDARGRPGERVDEVVRGLLVLLEERRVLGDRVRQV